MEIAALVIVIDDEPEFTSELVEGLFAAGIPAQSLAPSAIDSISELKDAHGIFLDIAMPTPDGFAWLAHIARTCPQIPIILMSGHGEDVLHAASAVAKILGIKTINVLSKPFAICDAIQMLNEKRDVKSIKTTIIPDFNRIQRALWADIESRTLEVHFQPKARVCDFQFAGAEALLSGALGGVELLPAISIVNAAQEQPVLLEELTWYVLTKAAAACFEWKKYQSISTVSVNVPALVLMSRDFIEKIESIRRMSLLEPGDITVELTEQNTYNTQNAILKNLATLRMLGYGIALDDIGQLSSGLVQFSDLPITEIKVDMRLVSDARRWRKARAIISALSRMASDLDIMLTAEGLERREDLDLLRELGATYVQGFLLSPKLPHSDLLSLIPRIPHMLRAVEIGDVTKVI